jgi:hypothetical protein
MRMLKNPSSLVFFAMSESVKFNEIAIHNGAAPVPFRVLGEITAKVRKGSLLSSSPTIEDVNCKLQEQASKMGANAVVNVWYSRGMTLWSHEVLTAVGKAVVMESEEMKCPFCTEIITRAAKKCKHCGSELPAAANHCPGCGCQTSIDALFCRDCGQRLLN